MDPQIAYRINARDLLSLLPYFDQSDLNDLRREFSQYLWSQNRRNNATATWQEAWNAWSGAQPHRAGSVRFTPARCKECKGRRFSHHNVMHNLNRTGSPHLCGACSGSGRGTSTIINPRYAAIPTATPETTSDPTP